jgi:hypothetical protein
LSPVSALTGTTTTSSRSNRAAADRTSPANSSKATCLKPTASILLMATMTVRTPISAHTVRCRCVCGRMPRVASTSRIAMSAVEAATAMLRVYCSCPGASAMIARRPEGRYRWRYATSMVMPCSCSASRPSVSIE